MIHASDTYEMPERSHGINWWRFCNFDPDIDLAIQRPFVQKDRTYATDGVVALEFDGILRCPASVGKKPSVNRLVTGCFDSDEHQRWGLVARTQVSSSRNNRRTCPGCSGQGITGWDDGPCPACSHATWDRDCSLCGGCGMKGNVCHACRGSRRVPGGTITQIGPCVFEESLIDLVDSLPGGRILFVVNSPFPSPKPNIAQRFLAFSFDHGRGLIAELGDAARA